MSSAILYLAIVAIWAGVLMPRWLRPHGSRTITENHFEAVDPIQAPAWAEDDCEAVEDSGEQRGDADANHGQTGRRPAARADQRPARARPAASGQRAEATGGQPAPRRRDQAAAGPTAAERRARVLQARRRTLVTLIVLTAGAVGIAVAHLAASWVVIPPVLMLAGFLLLLREAARIDAERAQAARPQAARGGAGRAASQARVSAAEPYAEVPAAEPTAEIIDISGRLEDQPYDQYKDAAARAVGD